MEAVSYTHLDVYKRQLPELHREAFRPLIAHRFQKPDIVPQCIDRFVDIAIAGSQGMGAIKIPKAKSQCFPQKLFQLD